MKKKIILISIVVAVFLGAILGYKLYYMKIYSIERSKVPKIEIKDARHIQKRELNNTDYFKVNNVMIKNDFEQFEKVDEKIDSYILYDDDNKVKAGIKFLEYVPFVEGLLDVDIFGMNNTKISEDDIENFMKKHNFKDDFDFIEYLSSIKDENVTFFTSIEKRKDLYIGQFLMNNILVDGAYRKIDGDYDGYYVEIDANTVEANIVVGGKKYIITFSNRDYFTEKYIDELISTLKFD